MEARLPETDPALCHALENYCITLWYCFLFEEAIGFQEKAVTGLKRLLGKTDLNTLMAIEGLARTQKTLGAKYMKSKPSEQLGRRHLEAAYEHISFVVEERIKQLGNNQLYTWLAKCSFGAIKGAMGALMMLR